MGSMIATGIEKLVDAKKMTMIEIHEALEAMTQTENRVLKKFKPGVKSLNPAIRPIWSPYHQDALSPFREGVEINVLSKEQETRLNKLK
ncbi:hypothetical protein O9G_002896 [Rozella allomycis CSF55]|uniref:Uncharacterized protein n=1 Tax=Rozella allomycis (strain CSF55) TaxID=988480 RepID=A0A075B1Z6_ROZAC|nr:hypothetical protein O9G_002896 [Rozella allomycis CSF55]|eukprot:EPZ36395.1 hypothetical protein O9G_002896 [Rozella allomycis CSF55]